LFGRILSVIGGESAGTDQEIVETLKRKYSIESREVDQGFTWYVLDHSLTFAIINWSILGGLLTITWPIPLTAVKVAQLSLHAALVGYILLLPVLALVHLSRNKHYVDKISGSKDAYENACLVAGEAHHAEVGTTLESTSGITVMNPDPEDPSLTTRVTVAFINSVRKITNRF